MSRDVQIYAFTGGSIKQPEELMFKGSEAGGFIMHPIPFFVIRHGSSYVAVDTGMSKKVAADYVSHWGEALAGMFTPYMKPEDAFSVQVKNKLGLAPADFSSVVLTHGHLDHSGEIEAFRDTGVPIYIQKTELEVIKQALGPEGVLGYIAAEFKPIEKLNFKPIDGVFDLFGDESVVLFPMPGHTPGMQALLVKTDKRTYVIASDACNTVEQLEKTLEPYVCADASHSLQGLHILKVLKIMGAEIIPMHDSEYWEKLPLAPKPLDL